MWSSLTKLRAQYVSLLIVIGTSGVQEAELRKTLSCVRGSAVIFINTSLKMYEDCLIVLFGVVYETWSVIMYLSFC